MKKVPSTPRRSSAAATSAAGATGTKAYRFRPSSILDLADPRWKGRCGIAKPLFGTNPLSFAWPRHDQEPAVFDMATAAMARGEIQVAAREGHSVPEGAGIDKDGNVTTDRTEDVLKSYK